MLHDRCPHCLANVFLPGELLVAGPQREGVAQLDHCLVCAKPLTTNWRDHEGTLDFSLTAPWELTLLKNGRAVLASLLHRRFFLEEQREEFSLKGLRRIQKLGILPHDHFQLNQSEMLRRQLKKDALSAAVAGQGVLLSTRTGDECGI